MQEHFRLLFTEHAPPEKWLALGKYCLQQSGLAPEITELVKAQGPLYHRQVKPADGEGTEPDPFSDLVVESFWQRLRRAGPVLWQLLTEAPRRGETLWSRMRVMMPRVSDIVRFLTGGFPNAKQTPYWLQPLTPLYDVFAEVAQQPFRAADVVVPRTVEPVLHTVRAQAEAHVWPVLTDAAASGAEVLSHHSQQHLLGQPSPEAERLAREVAAEERWLQRWSQTVRTETANAHATGAVALIRHEAGPETAQVVEVVRIPSARACLICRGFFLEADGAPKLYPLSVLLSNGTNQGRRQADWLPCIGPIHINCICSPPMTYLPLMDAPGGLFDRMRAAHVAAQRAGEASRA